MRAAVTTLFVLSLHAGTVCAQHAVIEHCRKTSSDADRIACLEAALLAQDNEMHAESELQAAPIESASAVAEADAPPAADAPIGIGAEQVIARNQTQEEILADLQQAQGLRVKSYAQVPYQRTEVTLENGQVWRQIKGDTQVLRVDLKRNQTVDIDESSLGGYRLRLNEMRRTIRVQRVR